MEKIFPKSVVLVANMTPDLCAVFPDTIFVFGDNLDGWGTAGQACIRHRPNSFGVPTKRKPTMHPDAFFRDREDEFDAVNKAIDKLEELFMTNHLVFPSAGLGTGLARMPVESPKLFSHMIQRLSSAFGVYYGMDTYPILRRI